MINDEMRRKAETIQVQQVSSFFFKIDGIRKITFSKKKFILILAFYLLQQESDENDDPKEKKRKNDSDECKTRKPSILKKRKVSEVKESDCKKSHKPKNKKTQKKNRIQAEAPISPDRNECDDENSKKKEQFPSVLEDSKNEYCLQGEKRKCSKRPHRTTSESESENEDGKTRHYELGSSKLSKRKLREPKSKKSKKIKPLSKEPEDSENESARTPDHVQENRQVSTDVTEDFIETRDEQDYNSENREQFPVKLRDRENEKNKTSDIAVKDCHTLKGKLRGPKSYRDALSKSLVETHREPDENSQETEKISKSPERSENKDIKTPDHVLKSSQAPKTKRMKLCDILKGIPGQSEGQILSDENNQSQQIPVNKKICYVNEKIDKVGDNENRKPGENSINKKSPILQMEQMLHTSKNAACDNSQFNIHLQKIDDTKVSQTKAINDSRSDDELSETETTESLKKIIQTLEKVNHGDDGNISINSEIEIRNSNSATGEHPDEPREKNENLCNESDDSLSNDSNNINHFAPEILKDTRSQTYISRKVKKYEDSKSKADNESTECNESTQMNEMVEKSEECKNSYRKTLRLVRDQAPPEDQRQSSSCAENAGEAIVETRALRNGSLQLTLKGMKQLKVNLTKIENLMDFGKSGLRKPKIRSLKLDQLTEYKNNVNKEKEKSSVRAKSIKQRSKNVARPPNLQQNNSDSVNCPKVLKRKRQAPKRLIFDM